MKAENYATQDEEYSLPPLEALLAGTLALMTGYAQNPEGCVHRPLMARKLVRNLTALAQHPAVSEPMRTMLGRLVVHWCRTVDFAEKGSSDPLAWMHAAPVTLQ